MSCFDNADSWCELDENLLLVGLGKNCDKDDIYCIDFN